MVVNYDMFWWEQDNVTDLCLGNCSAAASLWYNNVMTACKGQWLTAYGKWIPADTIAGRYVDGLNTVCLHSSSNEVMSSLGENTTWCLIESQNWVGSDVYQVDCSANPSDPSCANDGTGIDPSSERMANIYSNDMLCDDCFVQMLYTKVTSEFLTDTDHADYLVGQLQDIADVCNTSIPAITTRAAVSWDSASAPTLTTTTTTAAAPTSCAAGQGQTLSSGSGCDALSKKYGITTGDLIAISGSNTCSISSALCFPLSCSLQQIVSGATCDTVASTLNATTVQFQTWNPNIIGLCDVLQAGQYVCKSPPGASGYTLAPPPLGTDADAGNQQRGGSGGVVTPTTTISPGPTTPVPAPGTVQSGVSKMCNAWQTPAQGLGCVDFSILNGIGSDKFYEWNPVLGPNGENCTTMFQFKVYYCVGVVISGSGSGPTTSLSSPTITSVVTAPGPTQSGIVASCTKFAKPTTGTGCYDFATQNGITPTQLYQWNTVLGPNGENCGTQFWGDEYYCVGVSVQ
ncbi:carbohydrate-binding module family 50 protein [Lophiostoma macrostomum CBS 122681]|uniref:Carbohydrate-binding module family 50 protein n=1 Tax=Lophiostoma macrostomum CBS 122681 TaxID=1314788 RepID=A0A6A6SRE1_9PLEO|nr:carbohydrate-binding module family 50 protein [Lophiostoma macrostomum CBS 122681]